MKGRIPDSILEEVRNRVNIEDVVSPYVTLKKAGKNLVGLCPFHRENKPSFTVNPEKQIFYCFGCGEGGDAINFLMRVNGVSFTEAIRELARITGVVLPDARISTLYREGVESKKEVLLRVNALAEGFYVKMLFSNSGSEARRYLKGRGITEEAVKAFGLGYSPDTWGSLRDFMKTREIPLSFVEEAGLILRSEKLGYYDRFRGRVMFPIKGAAGKTLAFGGRIIKEGDPKYLNSPETLIYRKGEVLYGFWANREDIRKEGFAIVVEGYLDLLSLWCAGVRNVVSTLGTALTPHQVYLLQRYTPEVALVFDSDEAGRRALSRGIGILMSKGIKCRAITLPDGYDPDEFVRHFGPSEFTGLISKAKPAMEYYLETSVGSTYTTQEFMGRLREAIRFVAEMENPLDRRIFVRRIAEYVGIDENLLADEVDVLLRSKFEGKAEEGESFASLPVRLEIDLIKVIVEHPDKVEYITKTGAVRYFENDELRELVRYLEDQKAKGYSVSVSDVLYRIYDENLRSMCIKRLMEPLLCDGEKLDRLIADVIVKLKSKWYRKQHQQLRIAIARAEESGDEERCRELLLKKQSLIEEEKTIKESLGR
ncbi:MAG: DNA primase [Syntrophales bacterium]|nr:DNA primase [Syntrophales bacterium]